MADAKQPDLPDGTPDDVRKFVECTSDKLELKAGKLDWIPLDVTPDVKFDQPKGQKDKVGVQLGAFGQTLATIPVAVTGGRLSVDTTSWPGLLPGKDGVEKWVRDLNDWMTSRKKKFGGITVKDGNAVITKVALDAPAGAAVPPKEGAGVKTKAIVGAAAVALLAAGAGVLVLANRDEKSGDKATVNAANPPVQGNTASGADSASGGSPAVPISFPPYTVYSSCIGVEVNGNTTDLIATGTLVNLMPGTYRGRMMTGNGPVDGSVDVAAGASFFRMPFHFTQFTTVQSLELTAPDQNAIAIYAYLAQLPFDLDVDTNRPNDCDGTKLDSPTTPGSSLLIRTFLHQFGQNLRTNAVDPIQQMLDEAVIQRYLYERCRSHVATLIDPTQNFVLKSFTPPADYSYTSDGLTTVIPNTFTVQVEHTRLGQTTDEEIHLHQDGETLSWFTDCGDPAAASPN